MIAAAVAVETEMVAEAVAVAASFVDDLADLATVVVVVVLPRLNAA